MDEVGPWVIPGFVGGRATPTYMGLWGLEVDFVDSSGTPSPTVSPLTQGNQDILYGFVGVISEAVAEGATQPWTLVSG